MRAHARPLRFRRPGSCGLHCESGRGWSKMRLSYAVFGGLRAGVVRNASGFDGFGWIRVDSVRLRRFLDHMPAKPPFPPETQTHFGPPNRWGTGPLGHRAGTGGGVEAATTHGRRPLPLHLGARSATTPRYRVPEPATRREPLVMSITFHCVNTGFPQGVHTAPRPLHNPHAPHQHHPRPPRGPCYRAPEAASARSAPAPSPTPGAPPSTPCPHPCPQTTPRTLHIGVARGCHHEV